MSDVSNDVLNTKLEMISDNIKRFSTQFEKYLDKHENYHESIRIEHNEQFADIYAKIDAIKDRCSYHGAENLEIKTEIKAKEKFNFNRQDWIKQLINGLVTAIIVWMMSIFLLHK